MLRPGPIVNRLACRSVRRGGCSGVRVDRLALALALCLGWALVSTARAETASPSTAAPRSQPPVKPAGRAVVGRLPAASASAPAAEALGPTLERILQTGTINLGHRESSVPFSYYDSRRQVVGYSHELMLRLLDPIKTALGLPALTIKLVPVTAQNRIPLLQNGTVDLECGSTTHNRERERQVAFSHSIFVVGTRLLVPTALAAGAERPPIQDFADLGGRRVVVTAGTTSERLLHTHAERQRLAVTILAARDHGEAFQRLQAGEAEAFMMDDALLHGLRAGAQRPEDWRVVGRPMSTEVYACAMRRDDPGFKRIVDAGLARLMQGGEALKLYQRWFQKPIPPKGLNLAWPPSDELLALYKDPNDRPRD